MKINNETRQDLTPKTPKIKRQPKAAKAKGGTEVTKITRRIVGRARFFQRALSLVTAK